MVPRYFKEIHWPIVCLTLLLTALGIFEIYSATFRDGSDFASRQFFWFLAGLLVFFLTMAIGYRTFLNFSYLIYGLTTALLLWVLFFAKARSGAHSWLAVGPLQLQPSEFSKIATILMLSHFLAAQNNSFGQKRALLAAMFLMAFPCLLVLKQPDLGTALVFIPMFLGMIFLWGVRFRYLLVLLSLALSSAPFLWQMLKPYQQKRILVFLNPSIDPIGASYTAIQSKIAVGSGGLFGKGWLHGTQTQLDFVPEHHTDFIFSVFSEEFGFLGTVLLLLLFSVLIGYVFQVMKHTTDVRARLLSAGIVSAFAFQVFVNIGMTIGIAPITGVTLPFMSYGGSSLVASFFAFGLLASIHKERSIF